MADQHDQDENGLDISDEEAEQLLADGVSKEKQDDERADRSEDQSDSDLGDGGKRALSAIRKERDAARKELNDTRSKLKQYEDQGKSDLERWEERASTAEARAGTAESKAKALEIAMERAPEHATVAQIRAVAKRVRGEDDESLEADADELFELLLPKPAAKVAGGRPKERLKGGSEPDEEVEETDPRKLAALLPRRR